MKRVQSRLIQLTTICLGLVFFLGACMSDNEPEIPVSGNLDFLNEELMSVRTMISQNPELALEKSDEIISIAESENVVAYSGKAKFYKGYIYHQLLQDVTKAYFNYQEALKDLVQTDSSSLKMKVYLNLGVLYEFYEQYDAAISSYKKALELEADLTSEELSDIHYNYGVALKLKGDDESLLLAEEAFTKSLYLAQEAEHHYNIARVHNQIGMMYKDAGEYEMARIAYNNNIRTYRNNPDPELRERVGKAFHGIGVTYMDEGKNNEAIDAFNKALVYKNQSGSKFITKYDLGTTMLRAGYTNEALTTWQSALQERHDRSNITQVTIYSDLSGLMESKAMYKEALGYSKIFNENMRDIMKAENRIKKENNKVLFADIIKEYDEFAQVKPLYMRYPVAFAVGILFLLVGVYFSIRLYYKSKMSRRLDETVARIRSEFHHLKVE